MKASVLGGTFFASIVNIGVEDVITTALLAIIGAVISFFVSVLLKFIFERLKIRFKK